jgi:hypothetical protein
MITDGMINEILSVLPNVGALPSDAYTPFNDDAFDIAVPEVQYT